MHVVMFGDQHPDTLGGAQVSMRLQRRFLERAGHTVTIVAPAMHRSRSSSGRRSSAAPGASGEPASLDARPPSTPDGAYVDLPSVPITLDREYSMSWPGRRSDRWLDAALAARPRIDVVHVQADFWGAFIGYRFARRHGIPVVHTMHNRLDVGIEATTPFPRLVLRVLNAWQRRAVGTDARGASGWAFLRGLASRAAAVTAPSTHFARRLEEHGVTAHVDVVWNGIDDGILEDVLAAAGAAVAADARPGASADSGRRPRFVWLGRMSPEKRLLPFLEALAESGVDADVELIGGGGQLRAAKRLVDRLRPRATVRFAGRMPYAQTLRRIAAADAVVQTSIGFETQGMTIFEAASLGTPSIVSDPDLAAELGSGYWAVGDGRTPDPSVAALATALREAASDISAGSPRLPDPSIRDRFRQSSRTAAMIEVYERVVAGRG